MDTSELTVPSPKSPLFMGIKIPHADIVVNFIVNQSVSIDADLDIRFFLFLGL